MRIPITLARASAESPGAAHIIELNEGRKNRPDVAHTLALAEDIISLLRRANERSPERGELLARATDASTQLASGLRALAKPEPNAARVNPPELAIFMLRPFQVLIAGEPVSQWPSLKAKLILKALLLSRSRALSKDELIERVWPDRGAGENNLHVAICHLRKAVPFIVLRDGTYCIASDVEVWTDVDAFEKSATRGLDLVRDGRVHDAARAFTACAELYRNELLAEDGREGWIVPIRQRLRDIHLDVLERLARYHLEEHDAIAAASVCARVLAIDTCNEAAHRLLMQCYAALGQPNLVQLQYRTCVGALRAQLGVAPSAQTTELYRRLARGE